MQELVETVGGRPQEAARQIQPYPHHPKSHSYSCQRATRVEKTQGHPHWPEPREGEAWLALRLVSPSPHSETGQIVATVSTQGENSVYTFEKHRWNRIKERLELAGGRAHHAAPLGPSLHHEPDRREDVPHSRNRENVPKLCSTN